MLSAEAPDAWLLCALFCARLVVSGLELEDPGGKLMALPGAVFAAREDTPEVLPSERDLLRPSKSDLLQRANRDSFLSPAI